jgi:DNA modification methylase
MMVKELPINEILVGDCVSVMKELPSESVDLVVTSPPYWGLRDYGVDGQIGLEEHPNSYIESLVLVAKQVKRLLKKSGSFYLNLGDSYYTHKGDIYNIGSQKHKNAQVKGLRIKHKSNWLQPKQLLLIPSRVAVALQNDGWILRNDIVWYKPNHMPSSVQDRLTNSWEHVFHFVKARKYYYDLDAIRKPHTVCGVTDKRPMGVLRQKLYPNSTYNKSDDPHLAQFQYKGKFEGSENAELFGSPRARTQRKKPYAVQERNKDYVEVRNPPSLEKIKKYLNLWRKKRGFTIDEIENKLNSQAPHHWFNGESYPTVGDWLKIKKLLQFDNKFDTQMIEISYKNAKKQNSPKGKNPGDMWKVSTKPFSGAHFATFPPNLIKPMIKSSCPKDGVVLDPFCGSRTALVVAHKLGRKWLGIDINSEYKEIAMKRLKSVGAFSAKLECFFEEQITVSGKER